MVAAIERSAVALAPDIAHKASTSGQSGFREFSRIICKRLVSNRPLRLMLMPIVLLMFLSNWAELMIPQFASKLPSCFGTKDSGVFWHCLLNVLLFSLLHYVLAFVYCGIIALGMYDVRAVLLCQCTEEYLVLDHPAYHRLGSGRILSLVTRHSNAVVSFATIMIKEVGYNLVFFSLCIYKVYTQAGARVLGIFLAAFLVVLLIALRSPMLRKQRRAHNQCESRAYNRVIDIFNNFTVIKSYNNEDRELATFRASLREYVSTGKAYELNASCVTLTARMAMLSAQVLLFLCCWQYNLCPGMDSAGAILLQSLFVKFKQRSMKLTEIVLGLLTCYIDILHSSPPAPRIEQGPNGAVLGDTGSGSAIEFRDVSILQNDAVLFANFSLDIQPGQKIAITGRNGSGKSTIIKALMRFGSYRGEIYLDGKQISNINEKNLRSQIAYVPQNPHLMNTSVLANLVYGAPGAAEEDVVKACMACNVHQVFAGLADGYHTVVGENAAKISGGQAQLINFMRAVLKDAPVMVLDEPTSNLDFTASQQLIDCIFTHLKDKTVVLSTHDPHQLVHFDKIVNIHDGQVAVYDSAEDFIASTGCRRFL